MSSIPPNLGKWIQHKLDNYKEKPRRGVPKGKPYAFPKRKYHAALLHLAYTRTFNLREIAKEAGVSYSLLLKWRTEKRFQRVIFKEHDVYCSVIINSVLSRTPSDWKSALRSIVNEAPGYSESLRLSLAGASLIWGKEFWKQRIKIGERIGSDKPQTVEVRQLMVMLTLGFFVLGTDFVIPRRNKQRKLNFCEATAKQTSSYLGYAGAVFKQSLEKDWKDEAEHIFDTVARFAENEGKKVCRLRKKLIERGLDAST
jgi:hypothetical protein